MIAALGIGCDGTKTVLGIREGATENSGVVSSLLTELMERVLDFSTPRLGAVPEKDAVPSGGFTTAGVPCSSRSKSSSFD